MDKQKADKLLRAMHEVFKYFTTGLQVLIVLVIAFYLAGCVTLEKTTTTKTDGTVITEVRYSRSGSMATKNVEFAETKDGRVTLSIDKSQGDLGQVTEVLNKAMDLAGMAAKTQTP